MASVVGRLKRGEDFDGGGSQVDGTGPDEDGDALGEADDEAGDDGARAFDFDEVDTVASQAWFGLWCGHARRVADFARYARRWIFRTLTHKKTGGTLHTHLRNKIGAYRKRGSPRERRGHIPGQRCIISYGKKSRIEPDLGDYEMDTVIGLQSGPVFVTIVDRRGRRSLLVKAEDKSSQSASKAITTALGSCRKEAHTLTFDNGKEFAMHQLIDEILDTTSYFAHPYYSIKTPTNSSANTSQKRIDFSKITDK